MTDEDSQLSRATLSDVARAAYVHPSTASRALRGVGRVHADTARRVSAAAAELGYFGNLSARLLQDREENQRLIAVCFDADSMTGITRNAQAFWYFLLQGLNTELAAQEISATQVPLESLKSMRIPIELLLVLSIGKPPLVVPGAFERIPLVVNEAYSEGVGAAGVIGHDHDAIAAAVCDHLRDRGAGRIALLPLSERDIVSRATVAAYEAWCAAHAVPAIVLPTTGGAPGTRDAVREAVTNGVDGIFAISGEMAAVFGGVSAAGRRCPDDVKIVGVGQGIMEPLFRPPLTSVFLDGEGSGREIALLIARLLKTRKSEQINLPWRLISRGSTAGNA